MDHLVCFLPGSIAIAATEGRTEAEARKLPTWSSWKKDLIIKPLDAYNLQRPETVESLFLMFRVTEDPIYRKWGWKILNISGHTCLYLMEKRIPP
ncbi:unnamed protein product [Penicillium manginii]